MDAETQKLLDAITAYAQSIPANAPGQTQAVQLEKAVIDFNTNITAPADLMMPPVADIPEQQPLVPPFVPSQKVWVWLPESGCYYEQ